MTFSTIAKGAAVGLTVGCVTCWMANGGDSRRCHRKNRAVQKKTEQAVKTIGTLVEDLADMIH